MTTDVLLIPNFGAEEGAGWGAPAYRPTDETPMGAQPARVIIQPTATLTATRTRLAQNIQNRMRRTRSCRSASSQSSAPFSPGARTALNPLHQAMIYAASRLPFIGSPVPIGRGSIAHE